MVEWSPALNKMASLDMENDVTTMKYAVTAGHPFPSFFYSSFILSSKLSFPHGSEGQSGSYMCPGAPIPTK